MIDFTRDEHGIPVCLTPKQKTVHVVKQFTITLELIEKTLAAPPIPKKQPPGTKN